MAEKRKRLGPSECSEIQKQLASGISKKDLAHLWGVSQHAITYASLGGNPRRKCSDADDIAIGARYQNGESMSQIAGDYDTTIQAVRASLMRLGIERRTCTRSRTTLDEAAFDDAENNPEVAYWCGLLMADGCVHRPPMSNSYAITLSLKDEDEQHVRDFRAFLKSSHPVYSVKPTEGRMIKGRVINGGSQIALTVYSKRLVLAIDKYGVVPKKSLIAKAKLLATNKYFWCGVICGDGSVCIDQTGRPRITLAGASFELIKQFHEFVAANTESQCSIIPNCTLHEVSVTNRFAVDLAKILFADSPFALPRKKVIADKIIQTCKSLSSEKGWACQSKTPSLERGVTE